MSTSNQFNTQSISDAEEALQQSTNNATSSLSSDCPGKSFHIHVIVFCDVISSYTASITKQSTFPIFNLHKCREVLVFYWVFIIQHCQTTFSPVWRNLLLGQELQT